jgi:hypothetical protein
VRRQVAAFAILAAFIVCGAATAVPLRYGVADDWPKFHPCGDAWWNAAADIGYRELRMTIQWDATAPTDIPLQVELQTAVDCAQLNGLRPILSIYPAKPAAIGSSVDEQAAFAAFVGLVGQAFPGVQDFIIGNEPNLNRFWQPQFVDGHDAAATDYEHTLAQSYDALKLVRPDASVWGPAISSRGNDNPAALSNPSHSPVWFIKDLGDAYRASGRTTPIFDQFDMHPYPPVQDTDPFSAPFQWPQAGAANLDRVKQALWDAFHRTGQPTVAEGLRVRSAGETPIPGLPINLDEAGEQTLVPAPEMPAYDGTAENVIAIPEAEQALNHVELAEIAACDPTVSSLLYFPLIDDTSRSTGFQSGNLFADFAAKESYVAMKTKIASARGLCQGGMPGIPVTWSHSAHVVGSLGTFGAPGTSPGSQPARRPASARVWSFSVTAAEDATYRAALSRVTATGGSPRRVLASSGRLRAYAKPIVKFNPRRLPPGFYQFSITLTAATNPERTTKLRSKPFRVVAARPGVAKATAPGRSRPG